MRKSLDLVVRSPGCSLLQPNQILHLDDDKALVSVQGLGLKGPLLVTGLAYHREAMFSGQYGSWRGSGLCAAHLAVVPDLVDVAVGALGHSAVRRLTQVPDSRPLLLSYEGGLKGA